MRRACPACRASAPWPGRSWSWCTCSGAPGTWERISPGWMYRLGIEIGRKDDTMCEQCKVTPAVMGRAAGRKAQREHDAKVAADAVRAYAKGSAAPQSRPTPTEYAQRVLMVAGGIVLLASVNFLMHALLYTLAAVFTVLCGVAAVVAVRRRRRRLRTVIPAPLPSAPARTTVTGITVRALPASSPRSPQTAARELTGTPVRVRRGA
jgi:hypothetical protein